MKVLHFYKTYFPETIGGIEQVINQIIRSTKKLFSIESEVLTLCHDQKESTVMVNDHLVHRCPITFEIASTPFSLSAIKRFKALAKRTDVIHYQFPWPFMDVVHFLTRVKKPTVVSYQSDIVKQKNLLKLYQPLQKHFLASVDRIVATSPNYLATSSVLSSYADKVVIIPNGLNRENYPAPEEELLQHWKNKLPERFFLFVGVLRYYKGLHILLAALQGTDYPVVIAGSGPLEKELKAQAKSLNLKNIYFLDQISDEDKIALLTLCSAFVFPSHLRSEAFGISLLEAAMFGKPLISCEIGTGTSFINVDQQTGLVVPPADPAALREAMRYLWEHPERAAVMGTAAEQRYWDYFTADRMAAAYAKLYQELAG